MHRISLLLVLLSIVSCKQTASNSNTVEPEVFSQTEAVTLDSTTTNDLKDISAKDFREFKVLDSKHLTKAQIWEHINPQMDDFTKGDHDRLKSLILEQDIPTIQASIAKGEFSYEELTKFYLYRIRAFDRENSLSLNSVISINPSASAS